MKDLNRQVNERILNSCRKIGMVGSGLLSTPRVAGALMGFPVEDPRTCATCPSEADMSSLAEAQRQAFALITSTFPIGIVKAGPGTGKTHLSSTYLAHAADNGIRLLAAAPSAVAARVLLLKLKSILPPRIRIAAYIPEFDDHCSTVEEIRLCDVAICTVDSATRFALPSPRGTFDYVLLDEAGMLRVGQVLSVLDLTPKATRLVLVGDSKQLSPVVHSKRLKRTMILSGAIDSFQLAGAPSVLLTTQFRMPKLRGHHLGLRVYGVPLAATAKQPEVGDLILKKLINDANYVRGSASSKSEATWALSQSLKFLRKGGTVAILCLYQAQVDLVLSLKELSHAPIDVLTVSSAQGSEWDRVVLLTTVCRPTRFMLDPRLVNVAMSRDKLGMAISASVQYLQSTQAARSVLAVYEEVGSLPPEIGEVLPHECDQFSSAVEELRRNAVVVPVTELGTRFSAALKQVTLGTSTVAVNQVKAAATWRGHEIPLLLDCLEPTEKVQSQAVTWELKEDDALICEAEMTMKVLLERLLQVRGSPVESGRLLATTWTDPCPPALRGWLSHLSVAMASRSLELHDGTGSLADALERPGEITLALSNGWPKVLNPQGILVSDSGQLLSLFSQAQKRGGLYVLKRNPGTSLLDLRPVLHVGTVPPALPPDKFSWYQFPLGSFFEFAVSMLRERGRRITTAQNSWTSLLGDIANPKLRKKWTLEDATEYFTKVLGLQATDEMLQQLILSLSSARALAPTARKGTDSSIEGPVVGATRFPAFGRIAHC